MCDFLQAALGGALALSTRAAHEGVRRLEAQRAVLLRARALLQHVAGYGELPGVFRASRPPRLEYDTIAAMPNYPVFCTRF